MSDDYEVGYGKPPKAHRFQKGQSGNPRGRRPKAERSMTRRQLRRDFLLALETEIDARVPGQSGKVTVNQAIIWKQIQKALNGDLGAARFVMDYRDRFTDEHAEAHPDLMAQLEEGERRLVEEGNPDLRGHNLEVFNGFRKMTREV